MKLKTIIVLLFVFLANKSISENIVVLAKVKKQSFAGQVSCPQGHICMDVWIRYHLNIEKVLSKSKLGKKIKAIQIQHTEYINLTKEPILFILEKINDPQIRKYRKADYIIKEMNTPESVYCFENTLSSYILRDDVQDYYRHGSCMSSKVLDK